MDEKSHNPLFLRSCLDDAFVGREGPEAIPGEHGEEDKSKA
jgi:hypothetical protein